MVYYIGFALLGVGAAAGFCVAVASFFVREIEAWWWLSIAPLGAGMLVLAAVTLYERFTDEENTKYKDKN